MFEYTERPVGNCEGMDVNIFFPAAESDERGVADRYCADCPVKGECLEYAFSFEKGGGFQVAGVWGFSTFQDRRRLRKEGFKSGEEAIAILQRWNQPNAA